MTKFALAATNSSSIVEFEGEKICDVSSNRSTNPRWTEFHGYKTTGGNYIVEKVGMSAVKGEQRRVTVLVFKSVDQMKGHLGTGKLAMEFYQKMGVAEPVIYVE